MCIKLIYQVLLVDVTSGNSLVSNDLPVCVLIVFGYNSVFF